MPISIIFPPEILDHIFSFLDHDPSTWSTLKACSETTRNPLLRAVVDRRLYAHIVVTNFKLRLPGLFYHSDLFECLSANPHAADYIRTFQIQMQLPGPSRWYDQIISILRMLPPTLKGISLSSRPKAKASKIVRVTWSRLHAPFRKAFLDCLWSPNLTDVSMQCIEGVPLSIFNRCANLQRVSLQQVHHIDYTTSTSAPDQFPPQITSLEIDRTSNVPEILSWASMGHNLRSLSFRSECGSHYPLLTKLFNSYSDTLIELELDFKAFIYSVHRHDQDGTLWLDPYPPPLSLLPNLKKLAIWDSILSTRGFNVVYVASPIPTIARFVATSSSLKRLILHVVMAPWHIEDIAMSDNWAPLISLTQHPSLEHIELGVASKKLRGMASIDMISVLMGVPELKQMCEESFLSMEKTGLGPAIQNFCLNHQGLS